MLYGLNAASAGVVCWDRWAQDNHNSVILGRSGGGKSYLAKLDILRSLYAGVQVAVIDPEDEYARLAEAVGGTLIRPGAAGVRLNPFDLPAPPDGAAAAPDGLLRRALFLHTFVAVLLGGQPGPADLAVLDQAIMACYQAAGITADPRTWARPAPLLADLAAALARPGAAGRELAARLHPWTPRHPLGPVRRADHHPARRAPGRVEPARPARGAEDRRDAAGPGRHLAAGHQRPARPAAGWWSSTRRGC